MKRTVEIVLTSIGLTFSLIGSVMVLSFMFISQTDSFKESFEEGFTDTAVESSEPAVASPDSNQVLDVIISFGWVIFAVLLLSVVAAIIAIYFYVGNKKPKPASIIMIVTGVIVGIGTLLTGFLPAILFLIAGIVGLTKKPPVETDSTDDVMGEY